MFFPIQSLKTLIVSKWEHTIVPYEEINYDKEKKVPDSSGFTTNPSKKEIMM